MIKRILIFIGLSFIPFFAFASTLYDYYDTGNDNWNSTYGVNWNGQSFTATTTYTVDTVELMLDKDGTPITPATVSIRATASGLPTGSDLCSGTKDPTTFQTSAGTFESFTMSAGCNLLNGYVYAIVVRCINCTGSGNDFNWNMDYANASYAGGVSLASPDSGANWSVYEANTDMMFRVLGTASTPPGSPSTLDYTYILSMIMLGVFILILIDFIRRLAMGL